MSFIDFNKQKNETFLPRIKAAIAQSLAEIKRLSELPLEEFTEHSVYELEAAIANSGEDARIFALLNAAQSDSEKQKLAQEIFPLLSEFKNDVFLNQALYQRIKSVYNKTSHLKGEERKLISDLYEDFVRNGAELKPEDQKKLRQIDSEIAKRSTDFSNRLLNSTNNYYRELAAPEDLTGLPESVVLLLKANAEAKGKTGYALTLDAPTVTGFLKFSARADLREELWLAFNTRATSGEFDNRGNILALVKLKLERAQLLGFRHHADYVLQKSMAGSAETVMGFLHDLLKVAKTKAKDDLEQLQGFRLAIDGKKQIQPWDYAYYAELYRQKHLEIDEEKIKEYFPLDKVLKGMLALGSELYDLDWRLKPELKTYHPDTQTYEVWDKIKDKKIGYLIFDFHPRTSKQAGAWLGTYQPQGRTNNKEQISIVSIVGNLNPPSADKPALLSLMDVKTLFHEFGHALHALLSDCRFTTMSGTQVHTDFVELPSQIMENFVLDPLITPTISGHYLSHEPLPQAIMDKLTQVRLFQAGYMALRQLHFGFLDMAWHTLEAPITDVFAFEANATENTHVIPRDNRSNFSCAFSHIFSSSRYAAGYYGYKWAEVLDADAFELFKEQGVISKSVAQRFRNEILSRGASAEPMELYKKFRGRQPDVNYMLKRDGLL